ncbi:hypothetical protein J4413_01415 [Candidatus Woesearchaeota archaeon]|nr:hypothetical protein [Candidatus Woesearchaeota archaeon]
MLEFNAKIKKWGNSLGLIIPKDKIDLNSLNKDKEVHVIVLTKSSVLKETFGLFSEWKGKGQKMKDRLRKELYND